MAERYEIVVKVVSQKGTCVYGHKVGDEWTIQRLTPGGICLGAFNNFYPFFRVLNFGGGFPYEKDPSVTRVACPDPNNPAVFELRRGAKID
ncbi:TIGR04076 family protein [Chloroflexota bacterium]